MGHSRRIAKDINMGDICYLANIYIEPEFRFGSTILSLKRQFMERYKDCTVFTGEEDKRCRRWRVFLGGRHG